MEPPHIHVVRQECAAKLWLKPLEFAKERFRAHECRDIYGITEAHIEEFLAAWYRTFSGLQP